MNEEIKKVVEEQITLIEAFISTNKKVINIENKKINDSMLLIDNAQKLNEAYSLNIQQLRDGLSKL